MTTPTPPPEQGAVYTYERTFTEADVREFADLSGDAQARHVEPDDDGRLMVQGLLTATLPTKIGGDHDFLARRMEFEFVQPVYTGDTVTCEWTNETVEERADRFEIEAAVVCRFGGEVVLTGEIDVLLFG